MFDPEKVKRYQGYLADQPDKSGDDMWVQEEDFDRLLADYKEAISQIRVLIKERDSLVPRAL